MKWYYLLTAFAASFLLFRCVFFGKQIIYSYQNNDGHFSFTSTNPDTGITHTIDFWTMEINTMKDEPLKVFFIFSEKTPNVKKFQSIKVFLRDAETKTELPVTTSIEMEYFNGKNQIKVMPKNDSEMFNSLINWSEVNYKYEFLDKEYTKDDAYVTYHVNSECPLKKYADTLQLEVVLTWENGVRKYETAMIKGEYKGRKINPKF